MKVMTWRQDNSWNSIAPAWNGLHHMHMAVHSNSGRGGQMELRCAPYAIHRHQHTLKYPQHPSSSLDATHQAHLGSENHHHRSSVCISNTPATIANEMTPLKTWQLLLPLSRINSTVDMTIPMLKTSAPSIVTQTASSSSIRPNNVNNNAGALIVGVDSAEEDDNACQPSKAEDLCIVELMQPTYEETFSTMIWQYFLDHRQSNHTFDRKQHLRDTLLGVIHTIFESADIFIVGSSMNGFGTEKSDLDLCLNITAHERSKKNETMLNQLLFPLKKCIFISKMNLIRARVSILKFYDSYSGLECDLNIDSITGIYNTHLLAMYTRVDWRLRPLVMIVKHWAVCLGIHDASLGRLSSYSLVLMVIHYLQVGVKPAVLPTLQKLFPNVFNNEQLPDKIDMRMQLPFEELRSSNELTLFQLFRGFIEYYSEKFEFDRFSISIRLGKALPIEEALRQLPAHEQLMTAHSFKIFVEEPFTLLNTAHPLNDDAIFARVRKAFRSTLHNLKERMSLQKILSSTL